MRTRTASLGGDPLSSLEVRTRPNNVALAFATSFFGFAPRRRHRGGPLLRRSLMPLISNCQDSRLANAGAAAQSPPVTCPAPVSPGTTLQLKPGPTALPHRSDEDEQARPRQGVRPRPPPVQLHRGGDPQLQPRQGGPSWRVLHQGGRSEHQLRRRRPHRRAHGCVRGGGRESAESVLESVGPGAWASTFSHRHVSLSAQTAASSSTPASATRFSPAQCSPCAQHSPTLHLGRPAQNRSPLLPVAPPRHPC